ncbi:peptidoglycan-binding protein [Halobacteriales archaeon QH_10_65_19]|nr:MAG: peptidoglycan-binding protein [Halobacteriales archaeon QH_10_65_19]
MSGSGGSLERAEIEILNGKNKGDIIECKFNPPEYTTQKELNYGELQATGSGASVQQFVDGSAERLKMELFFDTSEQQEDVRDEYVSDFDKLTEVDPELHAPPICQFVWGKGLVFTALVEQLNKTSPESTDKTKAWTVTEGDTLWLIAAKEYGDPTHWHTIAETNNIHNPRSLETGQELELPPL